MKKAILFILMTLMVVQLASANVFEELSSGVELSGVVENSYEVDGYIWELESDSNDEFIFKTDSVNVEEALFLKFWLEEITEPVDVALYNYETDLWDVVGNILATPTKQYSQVEVANYTDYINDTDNTMRLKLTATTAKKTYVWMDKFLVSGASQASIISRVDSVQSLKSQPPTLDVLGTYYEVGDLAKVIAQISVDGAAINDASCFASIYHPDNTVHIRHTRMHHIDNSDGLYVYDTFIPTVEQNDGKEVVGVWPLSVVCDFDTVEAPYYPMNIVYNAGVSDGGPGTDYWYDDDVYSLLQTEFINSTTDEIDIDIYFYNVTDPLGSQALRFFIEWQGYTTSLDDAYVSWWDDTNSEWDVAENVINGQFTDVSFESPQSENESVDNYVDSNGTVKLKIQGYSPYHEETITMYLEDFEDVDQQLADTGSYGNFSWNETIDDIDLYINTTGALSGTSSFRITGNSYPLDVIPVWAIGYEETFASILYDDNAFNQIHAGDIKVGMKYKPDKPAGLDWEERGFMRFNITDQPGTYITEAILNLHYHEVKGTAADGDNCIMDFMEADWYPIDSGDWSNTGTVMFQVDTDDVFVHVDDPHDVTAYVDEGEWFSLVLRANWADGTQEDNDECLLAVEEDIRVELQVTYADGEVEVFFPVDTTDFWDMSVSWEEEMTGALASDNIDFSISSNGGSTWSSIYSFTGNHPFDTDTVVLSAAYDDNPNVLLRVTAQINHPTTEFRLDDLTFTGTHRIPHDIYTDYINLISIDAATVINEVRGGGEFNVKDRVEGIELNLSDIIVNIEEVFTNDYELRMTSADVITPFTDPAPINVYLYKVADKSDGVSGASCSLSARGPATSLGPGPQVLTAYAMTDQGAGNYYASPPVPAGGWPVGIYTVEVNCQYGSDAAYVAKNIRVDDNIPDIVWQRGIRTLTQEGYNAIADEIWTVNRTIEPGLTDQMRESVWSYVARYVHGEILN